MGRAYLFGPCAVATEILQGTVPFTLGLGLGQRGGGREGRERDLRGMSRRNGTGRMVTDLVGGVAGVDGQDGDGAVAFDDPGTNISGGPRCCWDAHHFSTAYIW